MKQLFVLMLAALIFAPPVDAQTSKPADPPKSLQPANGGLGIVKKAEEPPTFTDKQKAAFFKAQSETFRAQVAAQQTAELAKAKQDFLQTVVNDLEKTCGDKFTAQINQGGDPVCVTKPEPKKETK